MKFAARTAWDATTNRLTRQLEERRRSGLPILDLTETNPTRCGFVYPAADILRALARPESLEYRPDPRGLLRAREAIAALYATRGATVPPERLLLTASTSEAYSFLFRLLADPGDRILIPSPSYPLFDLLGRLDDVSLVPYPLLLGGGFSIDLHALERAVDRRTRAILVVSPGNPTGAFLRAEMTALARIAAEHDLPIVADEVFGDYSLNDDPERVSTMAGVREPVTFVLNGLSKMLALPQLKLAWIAVGGGDEAVADALGRLDVIADTYLSVGTPVQWALPDLLPLRPRIQSMVMERIRGNLAWLLEQTSSGNPGSVCSVRPPDGGWSAILDVPRTRGEEEWSLRLLDADGVLVHPGYFFDFPGEGRLVVSLLPQPAVFREGIARLLHRLDAETRAAGGHR
jgi:aspartate/methionine/tyrosine aminotransferase